MIALRKSSKLNRSKISTAVLRLHKKIIVCRTITERPEAIETGHIHLCKSPESLIDLFNSLKDNYEINTLCPYGDGNSSIKIVKILENERF
jgi:UDP-N-acetylglucosamine 2-epimerase